MVSTLCRWLCCHWEADALWESGLFEIMSNFLQLLQPLSFCFSQGGFYSSALQPACKKVANISLKEVERNALSSRFSYKLLKIIYLKKKCL